MQSTIKLLGKAHEIKENYTFEIYAAYYVRTVQF